ncbi:short chain dehydrogenase [Rhizoctonia solani]|uniref:Short chain dehydrogenase n=1 Tax=Rhizoctonia solani TaxID=456999 RepID=A0A8H8P6N9_9AGAM|nr:short chain dehydrogenase [Rhizoctonia solani]QRW24788.1 short chain dehydrogenase [Rhizoctonia solani]
MSSFTRPSISTLIVDLLSDSPVQKGVEQAAEEVVRIDTIVGNACILCHGTIIVARCRQDAKECHLWDTSVLGVLRLARTFFLRMHMASKKRGTFIAIGSVAAQL